MAKFNYKMRFSPYGGTMKAKNYDEAWKKLKAMFSEYDLKKCCQYLMRMS